MKNARIPRIFHRKSATKGSQSTCTRSPEQASHPQFSSLSSAARTGKTRESRVVTAPVGIKRLGLAVIALVLAGLGAVSIVPFLMPAESVREAVKAEIRAVTGL